MWVVTTCGDFYPTRITTRSTMLQCDDKQPPQLYKYVVLLNYSSLSHGRLGSQSHQQEWDLRVSTMLQCDDKQPPQLYKYVVLLNYSSLSHGRLGSQSHQQEWDLRVSMSLHFVEANPKCNGCPHMPFKDSP